MPLIVLQPFLDGGAGLGTNTELTGLAPGMADGQHPERAPASPPTLRTTLAMLDRALQKRAPHDLRCTRKARGAGRPDAEDFAGFHLCA
jgi:hypothetical protein